jgi:hypothetical protein
MKIARLGILILILAAGLQGCAGSRVCSSHVTHGANSEPCLRECLSRDVYYKCECESNCPCWSSAHPGLP